MNKTEIFEIKRRMAEVLTPAQMQHLETTLDNLSETETDLKQDYVKNFLAAKRVEGCSERTEIYYQKTLRFFEKQIHESLLCVSTEKIRKYLADYHKYNGCKLITVENIRRILSSFYQWLENENYIIKSPVRRIHKIKVPSIIKPVFTGEEIEELRACSENNKRNSAIVNLLISSGIRVGELVKLNKRDINLNECMCIVFGKGGKERVVYFDVKTKIALEKYLKERKDKIPALFITNRQYKQRKHRLCINTIEQILRKYAHSFKYKIGLNPHKFRRSFATLAIDKGMPIEQVQSLLGHTTIDTTLIYAQVKQKNVMYSYRHFIG